MNDKPKPKLHAIAPIFHVHDVAATIRWYETHLAFSADPFPRTPPYAFCILSRDKVEIMLQRVEDAEPFDIYRRREDGAWHAYLRIEGLKTLYDAVRQSASVAILEHPHIQPYGDTEFVIRDPNGYVLVFGEGPASAR